MFRRVTGYGEEKAICTEAKEKMDVKAEIISNQEICPDHFLLRLKSDFLGRNSKPGQFVNVKVEERSTDPLLRVPLGIHRINKKGVDLLVKVVGQGTELLSKKKKKEHLNVLGPLGNGFNTEGLTDNKVRKALLVAGGHGIAPLYALAETLENMGIDVSFFSGAGTKDHVICLDQQGGKGPKFCVSTEDGSRGHKGYITALLERHLRKKGKTSKDTVIFACGPREMLYEVSRLADEHGIPAQVSVDAYMACGIGACLGCVIKTRHGYKTVCKDGPVFDPREIVW